MKFTIDVLALSPFSSCEAQELLTELGMAEWTRDRAADDNMIRGRQGASVNAFLFNNESEKPVCLEIMKIIEGERWTGPNSIVSHIGTHCSDDELTVVRAIMLRRRIKILKEATTTSHTNPAIGGRTYHYVIFATRGILGLDLEFIVRQEKKDG